MRHCCFVALANESYSYRASYCDNEGKCEGDGMIIFRWKKNCGIRKCVQFVLGVGGGNQS